jgi:phage N-6-adenine-methyltransferase
LQQLPLHSGLGQALKGHRKSARISQDELARRADLSVPTVRLLEAGRGNLDSWRVALAALGLELSGRNLPAGETLGRSLATLRRRRGLGQRELAALVGVSQRTILALERYEQGRLSTLEAVLVALGAGAYLAAEGTRRAFYTHSGNSSVGQAWETPQELLEALYSVFGRFDLDPCSPRKTAPPVRARVHFTAEDDGLSLPWHGRVFVNPPYGRGLAAWVAKARREFEEGRAGPVVLLIPSRTETSYWHEHVAGKAAVYFLRGRLRFGNGEQSAPFPSALAVWGAGPETLAALAAALPGAWRAN